MAAITESPDRKELTSEWKNEVVVKTIDATELKKHTTKKDLWTSIHGKVYDLTEYARDHPGGLESLLEVAGTDGTAGFEDVGHSEDARELLHGFLVGVVEGYKAPAAAAAAAPAVVPTVTKVNRSHAPKEQSVDLIKLIANPQMSGAAVVAAAAGIAWAVNTYGLMPTKLASGGSFGQGFLIGTVTLGVAGVALLAYLETRTNIKSFAAYDKYVSSAVANRGEFHPAGTLIPQEYQKFKLGSKKELSPGIWQFVFQLPTAWSVLGLPIGQHVAIKGEIDGHTVVRSYTPVSNNRDLGRLELLIRVYPKGQLGNYLLNLNIGDSAEFRGPKGAMRYRKGLCRAIGMVAGGTGITPMFQLIRAICEDPSDETQVSLIYANRSEGDIMLRNRLDYFAKVASHKFKVYYLLDDPPANWAYGTGRVNKEMLEERLPKASPDVKVMLCGPPPMVNGTKNTLASIGFTAPGAVSKMTDQIFCF